MSSDMHEYGIHTSKAHFWIHVCPGVEELFVYERDRMSRAIHDGKYDICTIATAKGALVPIDEWFVRRESLRNTQLCKDCAGRFATDREIGKRCEDIVEVWMRLYGGVLPQVSVDVARVEDRQTQFQGIDFSVRQSTSTVLYEVKADTRVADTGNLFVQTHEQYHQSAARHAHRQGITR